MPCQWLPTCTAMFDACKAGCAPNLLLCLLGLPARCRVDNSKGHSRDAEQGGEPGQQHKPLNSMTLQTAPLLPNGTTWTEDGEPGPGAAHHLQGANVLASSLLLLHTCMQRSLRHAHASGSCSLTHLLSNVCRHAPGVWEAAARCGAGGACS